MQRSNWFVIGVMNTLSSSGSTAFYKPIHEMLRPVMRL